MDFFFSLLRKTLTGIITLVFAFAVIYVPQIHNKVARAPVAYAQIPTGATEPTQIINTAQNTASLIKEKVLDPIAYAIAKAMLSQMLQSMVTWIGSGFEGSPAFIQDLDRFLLDVADEAAGEYLRSLGELGSFICEPFRIDIQLALSLKYQKDREGRRDSCSLSGIVDNVEDFFNGQVAREDFWEQWVEITSKPQTYTPYGQFMAAEGELNARIVNARGRELQIVNWADGFLSNEVCEAVEGPSGGERCVISTPGNVISEQLNNALGVGQDQLIAADEINEIISSLLGQIANEALMGTAGLLGLSAGSGYTSGSYGAGSYVNELANQASSQSGSFIENGYKQMRDKLDVQIEYSELAVSYLPRLLAVINNPATSAEMKDRAEFSRDDAIDVIDATQEHIRFLTPLVTEFETLQRELTSPTVTTERTRQIQQRQAVIITETSQYSAYTTARLRASQTEWSIITRP